MQSSKFSKSLLKWYDQYGRKNLPWRKKINPYRVWISEIMLQQTQVATVIPYYERFMQRFPDVFTLAHADIDEILNLWTGLGYYSRARNLHRAAKIIVENFQSKFPENLDSLQSLPGIGRSTAGAILAISMKQPTPILEGNVKRVLTRFNAIAGWPGSPTIQKKLWQLATDYTPQLRADDYTQAIMDLGATICARTKPACNLCPIKKNCHAFALGQQAKFPYKNPKKKNLPVRQTIMLLLQNSDGELLMEKRPSYGIWGGLWSFPECSTTADIQYWCERRNFQIKKMESWPSFRHTFSHFHLDITPVHIAIKKRPYKIMASDTQVWYTIEQPAMGGFASPVKRLLETFLHLKSNGRKNYATL